jgi:hypothetical protein
VLLYCGGALESGCAVLGNFEKLDKKFSDIYKI